MKKGHRNLKLVMIILAVFLVATAASTSFAHRGGWMGYAPGMMTDSQPRLTTDQQQKLDAVHTKYDKQLGQLQASINSKVDEYQQARENDKTTVGTLNQLEAQISDLKQQYWTVLDQANNEADKIVPAAEGSWFTCANDDHYRGQRMGMMYDGDDGDYGNHHMGYDHDGMMGGRYASCW